MILGTYHPFPAHPFAACTPSVYTILNNFLPFAGIAAGDKFPAELLKRNDQECETSIPAAEEELEAELEEEEREKEGNAEVERHETRDDGYSCRLGQVRAR